MLSWAKPINLTSSGISDPSIPEACEQKREERWKKKWAVTHYNDCIASGVMWTITSLPSKWCQLLTKFSKNWWESLNIWSWFIDSSISLWVPTYLVSYRSISWLWWWPLMIFIKLVLHDQRKLRKRGCGIYIWLKRWKSYNNQNALHWTENPSCWGDVLWVGQCSVKDLSPFWNRSQWDTKWAITESWLVIYQHGLVFDSMMGVWWDAALLIQKREIQLSSLLRGFNIVYLHKLSTL